MKHRYFLLAILFCCLFLRWGQESRADVGNTRETATDLTLDKPYTESVDAADDDDYFRIKVNKSGKLRVWTTRNVNTFGELQDSSGTPIGANDNGGRGHNSK